MFQLSKTDALTLDTALTTQSRLILLDSMLMLSVVQTLYFHLKFISHRKTPYTFSWWLWLTMTGVGLGAVMGIKMVGLFMVGSVGVATCVELWGILGRKGKIGLFWREFGARFLCLVGVPVFIYLSVFYVHFWILIGTGPGDSFMSLQFQSELIGNIKTLGSTVIPYDSCITLQHHTTGVYLHSHIHTYPLRYEDGRVSSQGQQVTGYAHSDANSVWILEEAPGGDGVFQEGSSFRLRHNITGGYLLTHDVASPLTKTHMEVTAVLGQVAIDRFNETIWKVQGEGIIRSKRDVFSIVSAVHGVALGSSKGKLPEWGFDMMEVNGNKKIVEGSNGWRVDNVVHESVVGRISHLFS